MPDLTVQAQADLLAKLLKAPETVVEMDKRVTAERVPFTIITVDTSTTITADERKLVEMILSGAHA